MAAKNEFCKYANKPCRTKEEAEDRANASTEYRRAYQCESCDKWHITSRLKREDEQVELIEPQEIDLD